MVQLTKQEAEKLGIKTAKANKPNKYHAKKIKVDGITFDSKKEADFYCTLKNLQKSNKIAGFCMQPSFLVTKGTDEHKGTMYKADFVVFFKNGTYDIIDVKGRETEIFKLKLKSFYEKFPKLTLNIVK